MINYYVSNANSAIITGLSSDIKPASSSGFVFIETDTGVVFYPNGGSGWTAVAGGGGASWGSITGTLSSQTDLQTALNAKANTSSLATVATTGAYADLSGKPTLGTLASQNGTFSGTSSGTNTGDNAANSLYSGLAASKQDTLVSATNIKTINGSSVLGSGDLVVSGTDPWTYVTLGSDFTISTTANNKVTGLNFTPAASTNYLIEGYYLLRTATATTGARPGIEWPTGYNDGASYTQAPNSATATAMQFGAPATGTANAASTGLPVINRSYLGQMNALLLMGGSPSGNFQITLASETAAVNVTMRAGSFIRYRTY